MQAVDLEYIWAGLPVSLPVLSSELPVVLAGVTVVTHEKPPANNEEM